MLQPRLDATQARTMAVNDCPVASSAIHRDALAFGLLGIDHLVGRRLQPRLIGRLQPALQLNVEGIRQSGS